MQVLCKRQLVRPFALRTTKTQEKKEEGKKCILTWQQLAGGPEENEFDPTLRFYVQRRWFTSSVSFPVPLKFFPSAGAGTHKQVIRIEMTLLSSETAAPARQFWRFQAFMLENATYVWLLQIPLEIRADTSELKINKKTKNASETETIESIEVKEQ